MLRKICFLFGVAGFACASGEFARAQYRLEMVTIGLNRPMFFAQATGDDSSLHTVGRRGPSEEARRILKRDLTLSTNEVFLDLAGLTPSEAYVCGDLDGDLDNDLFDFQIFRSNFDAAHEVGTFESLAARVSEPSTSISTASTTTCFCSVCRGPALSGNKIRSQQE